MSGRWHAALAWALIGEELPLLEPGGVDVAGLVEDLAEAGWPRERVVGHSDEVVSRHQVWPHPVPASLKADCGAAQFTAALDAARAAFGLSATQTRPPSARRRLDADERRLMREVPPHHLG